MTCKMHKKCGGGDRGWCPALEVGMIWRERRMGECLKLPYLFQWSAFHVCFQGMTSGVGGWNNWMRWEKKD